jgi:hypothetical protein
MIGITIDGVHQGDGAEITRVAAADDIAGFVEAVRDYMNRPPLMLSSAPVM